VGVAELVSNRITAGIAHLVAGIMCLGSLVLGGWMGFTFVNSLAGLPPAQHADPVPFVWQALWIPMLSPGLPIDFQDSCRDGLFVAVGLMVGDALVPGGVPL